MGWSSTRSTFFRGFAPGVFFFTIMRPRFLSVSRPPAENSDLAAPRNSLRRAGVALQMSGRARHVFAPAGWTAKRTRPGLQLAWVSSDTRALAARSEQRTEVPT